MKRFRGILLAFCFLLYGSSVLAEELSFCVLDDFLQIVTFKGPDSECGGLETPLQINSGERGPAGPQGPQGPAGPEGPTGLTGANGPAGPQGLPGVPGPQGATGPEGPVGTNGLNAFVNTTPEPSGPNCADGGIKIESGQDNVVSNTSYVCNGAVGQQGQTGPQGDTGATGPQGPQGPQGIQGDTGPTGPQGLPGVPGPAGATGPQGPVGTNGLNAFVNTTPEPQGTNCPGGGIKVEAGQDNIVNATSYVCNGTEGPQGQQGPQGDPGPPGPAGATGPAGPPGPTGAAGIQGLPGPTGATGPAGPPGPQGDPGPEGEEGEEGPTGPAGPTGATGVTILAGGTSGNLSSSSTHYVDMFLLNSNSNEANVMHAVPVAGALTDLNVVLNSTIGSAPNSYTFTVRQNGATPAAPLTCQVLGPTDTSCSDNVNCMQLNAGDTIDLQSVPNSSPSGRQARITALFRPGGSCSP